MDRKIKIFLFGPFSRILLVLKAKKRFLRVLLNFRAPMLTASMTSTKNQTKIGAGSASNDLFIKETLH